ncbi:acyl carrier protein [Lactobacillus sp.]|uniref:acyl carrier protein n=1 Tax=Lactobacillus sp. TaxID=1591 RepID=UPI0019BABA9A|nr:acyl carrier protein [Lactobacillus sp.]MBD5428981.1 acyl carrier protein [Lactobacillus sp.]
MTEEEIFNKIADMIADRFEINRDKITKDLNFQNDLDADSIDFVEFVMDMEDTFGSEIPDEEAEKLQTVGEAVEYIKEHQN